MRTIFSRRQIETTLAAMLAAVTAIIGLGAEDQAPLGPKFLALEKIGRFKEPVHLAQAPGRDQLYVVEKPGRVRVLNGEAIRAQPFLDLRRSVKDTGKGGEQGMLSIAFAPDYPDSGLLYVAYTDHRDALRVVEYKRSATDPFRADQKNPRLIMRIPQPTTKHHGGFLVFGPDGYLYVGSGDGGPSGDPGNVAQNKRVLLGKILRIDPRSAPPTLDGDGSAQRSKGRQGTGAGKKGNGKGGKRGKGKGKRGNGGPLPAPDAYTVPRDNPFVGRPGRDEIFAYGLRNPWRFSFDRATGALAIGDVGNERFEEVTILPAGKARGANFGWSAFEGFSRFKKGIVPRDRTVLPTLAYPHNPGCAVTGGHVVRDPRLSRIAGREIVGRYIYGDYCTGRLFAFRLTPKGRGQERSFRFEVPRLSSFGEDRAGRIYLLSQNGPVYRLTAKRKRVRR